MFESQSACEITLRRAKTESWFLAIVVGSFGCAAGYWTCAAVFTNMLNVNESSTEIHENQNLPEV